MRFKDMLQNATTFTKEVRANCLHWRSQYFVSRAQGLQIGKKINGLFYVTCCNFNFHVFYKSVIFVYVKEYRVEFTEN